MGARETALNVLIACRKEKAWSNGVFKDYVLRDRLDSREAALCSRLCYGVLQNRLRLDWYLGQLLTGRLKDLHPVVRDILHLGLYQLYDLDKIPDSAAVNESVQLTKKYCKHNPRASGLVNGVLRSAIRRGQELKAPESLSVLYSHPQKLIDLLESYVGKENLEPMLRANNSAPQTVAQVNTLLTTTQALAESLEAQGVSAQLHSWMSDCLVLSHTGDLEQLKAFQEGLFYIQDPAAKLAALCAKVPKKAKVLDCCAAPGGKSFACGIMMGDTGEVISCDIHPHKAQLIEKGAQRLKIKNIRTQIQDGAVFVPQWENKMDVVIADVPCSGYGIIRKKPDIRYKDPEEMKSLPDLQLKILSNQARYVKEGGVLLYATCTLVQRENEGVVEAFLRENPEFYREKLELPAPFPENTTGMLTLLPGQYDTDGFFFCRLRRR